MVPLTRTWVPTPNQMSASYPTTAPLETEDCGPSHDAGHSILRSQLALLELLNGATVGGSGVPTPGIECKRCQKQNQALEAPRD